MASSAVVLFRASDRSAAVLGVAFILLDVFLATNAVLDKRLGAAEKLIVALMVAPLPFVMWAGAGFAMLVALPLGAIVYKLKTSKQRDGEIEFSKIEVAVVIVLLVAYFACGLLLEDGGQ